MSTRRGKASKSDTVVGNGKRGNGMLGNTPSDKQVLMAKGFYLGEKLGSGSYSKVRFAAVGPGSSRGIHRSKVAVKIIDRRRAPSDYQQCFLPRELGIIKTLSHPNIIQTFDWFEENQKIYQILELAECGDVLEFVRVKSRGAVGDTLARRWIFQTAGAIAYLHSHCLAHRDVKCENLLLDSTKSIKLSDFGFARRVRPGELSRTFCGSAAYAAPEIIRSNSYDPYRSDVWALGVVAYILATGYMPFGDDVRNVSKILAAQLTGAKFPTGPTRHPISEACKSLINAMLVIDVNSRRNIQYVISHPWLSNRVASRNTHAQMNKTQQ